MIQITHRDDQDNRTQNNNTQLQEKHSELETLLEKKEYANVPQPGDVLKGTVLSVNRNEVALDIGGVSIGVIRGRELFHESDEYKNLAVGSEMEATVLEQENENGEIEMSFRQAGQKRTWDEFLQLKNEKTLVKIKITDANKGGLICRLKGIVGFLPVSQLSPEHYPRVQGGDKNKIFDRLKKYIGDEFETKVIDVNEAEEKLIVSEKAAWEETQKSVIESLTVGDMVEGKVTAVTDFGAFVEFGENLEGLVHISEIAWQRIENTQDILHVGDRVKAKIIKMDGSKIFLSMKTLLEDPWQEIEKRYQVGQIVSGKILKVNPFGLFIELDRDIHGLAHISELAEGRNIEPEKIAQEGETKEFLIISIEKKDHRLGLSLKRIKKARKEQTDNHQQTTAEQEQTPVQEPTTPTEEPTPETPQKQEINETSQNKEEAAPEKSAENS